MEEPLSFSSCSRCCQIFVIIGLGLAVPLAIHMTVHNYSGFHVISKTIMLEKHNIAVAIGMGVTSVKSNDIEQMPLFKQLLPSFCKTASIGYNYSFYFAYDYNDTFFNNGAKLEKWKKKFMKISETMCHHLGHIEINMIRCNHTGKPAWAQNDAMMAAYRDGCDFFYRVNDDTIMTSSNWTHIFIDELHKMVPPLVGVVGPTHRGGNMEILTYDFVHRTHMDIFGYYYPREFSTWHADGWITNVYRPGRSKKLTSVSLRHIVQITRYEPKILPAKYIEYVLNKTHLKLQNYLERN